MENFTFCLIFCFCRNVVFFLDSRDMSENKDLVSQQKKSEYKIDFQLHFLLFTEYCMASKSLGLRIVSRQGKISGNYTDFEI